MRVRGIPFSFAILLCLTSVRGQDLKYSQVVAEVQVVDAETRAPIPDVRVKIGPCDGDAVYGRTDARGRHERRSRGNIPDCTTVDVDRPEYLRPGQPGQRYPRPVRIYLNQEVVREQNFAGVTITRTEDSEDTLRYKVAFTLVRAPVVTGVITDPNGTPMSDCRLGFFDTSAQGIRGNGTAAQVVTNDQGIYRTTQLLPGSYYLVVPNRCGVGAFGSWDRTFRATYFPSTLTREAAKPVQVAAGKLTRADVQIVRACGVKVAGRLSKPAGDAPAGNPMIYTTLVLTPSAEAAPGLNGVFYRQVSGNEFEIPDVLPGKYMLVAATVDAGEAPMGMNRKVRLEAVREVEVGDRDLTGLDMEMLPPQELRGTVTFAEGCTPEPLKITAHVYPIVAVPVVETVSGADGSFVLNGLTPGMLQVRATLAAGGGVMMAPVRSVKLGHRVASVLGVPYPQAGDQALNILVGCSGGGRFQ